MTKQRAAANTARHILKYRLRSGFDFDDVIKRLAVRARKGIERRRFLLVKFYATPAGAQRHLIAALSGHIIVALL
jgi:hypothetical protein